MAEQILKSVRGEYGKTLVELGKKNKDVVVVDADLSCSTQTQQFAKAFPERFFTLYIQLLHHCFKYLPKKLVFSNIKRGKQNVELHVLVK